MPVDISRLEERMRLQDAQRRQEASTQANIVVAMGEKAAHLALSEPWRVWEDHVRALLAQDEQECVALRQQLESPDIAGDDLQRIRGRLLWLLGRMEARREDLNLPAELAKRGEQARSWGTGPIGVLQTTTSGVSRSP